MQEVIHKPHKYSLMDPECSIVGVQYVGKYHNHLKGKRKVVKDPATNAGVQRN